MDFVETEGDTIDDAIENALRSLGVARHRITVDIVSEGRKGIFGFGSQKAKIRAALTKSTFDLNASEATSTISDEQTVPVDDSIAVDKAKTALRQILDLMGVKATIEEKLAATGDETVLEIQAENSGLLIGRKGQTLEALQYLITRIAGERPGHEGRHLVVDIENYRARRRKSLEDMALRLGEKAKRQRKTVTVDALSAADRRIIHAALQDDPWVSTKSLGQGSYRRLLIIPEGDRKKKEAANPATTERPDTRAQEKAGKPTPARVTKNDTRDVRATVQQIWDLEAASCDIVRCAVPVREAAEKLGEIKKKIRIPLVADIHFNYKLALIAIEQGVDGLRLNPGNIGARKYVEEVVRAASERKIPIRIGVNAGSLEKDLLQKYNGPTAEGMVESGLRHIHILEDVGYNEIKISLKASDPLMMIEAYRTLAGKVDYPLHLGVTEAGTPTVGTIKSAVGLGTLLAEGIGDTIRVSLAADPVEEVRVGREILKALKLKTEGLTFVACPSCGRADVDLVALAKSVEERMLPYSNLDIHVAVMGCEVNGPGEARAADLGVAGGKGIGLIFKRGEVIRKVPETDIVDALMEEVQKFAAEKKAEQATVVADA